MNNLGIFNCCLHWMLSLLLCHKKLLVSILIKYFPIRTQNIKENVLLLLITFPIGYWLYLGFFFAGQKLHFLLSCPLVRTPDEGHPQDAARASSMLQLKLLCLCCRLSHAKSHKVLSMLLQKWPPPVLPSCSSGRFQLTVQQSLCRWAEDDMAVILLHIIRGQRQFSCSCMYLLLCQGHPLLLWWCCRLEWWLVFCLPECSPLQHYVRLSEGWHACFSFPFLRQAWCPGWKQTVEKSSFAVVVSRAGGSSFVPPRSVNHCWHHTDSPKADFHL